MWLRFLPYIGAVLALLGIIWAVVDHFDDDAKVRAENETLTAWQDDTIEAVVEATCIEDPDMVGGVENADCNEDVTDETAIGQVRALGDSHRELRAEVEDTNQRLDEMAAEAVRLRARAEELQRIAAKAEAMRRAALARLSDMAITPGTREDMEALLEEANAALDIAREAGL